LEFDRKDIKMNKLVSTGLESKFHIFEMRTFNEKSGYTSMSQKTSSENTTGWIVKHLPQNRDIFCTCSGSGTMDIMK
jgi:WD repeat-containing protein 92